MEISEWPPDGKGVQATKEAGHEFATENFTGKNCQGNYCTFETVSNGTNRLMVIIRMTIDSRVWDGRFAGSSDAWKQTLSVLKNIKGDGSLD